jgi:hypothetical protein
LPEIQYLKPQFCIQIAIDVPLILKMRGKYILGHFEGYCAKFLILPKLVQKSEKKKCAKILAANKPFLPPVFSFGR